MGEPENHQTKIGSEYGQLFVEVLPRPIELVGDDCAWQEANLVNLSATYGDNQVVWIVSPTNYHRQYQGPNNVHQQEF
jgi:hypothetical protein